jgi:4-oxalocrotonate tautomerase
LDGRPHAPYHPARNAQQATEIPMPLVTIKLARREAATTSEQKARLIAGITALMVETLGKRAEDVVVLIEELDPDNWGQGGVSATALRRARAVAKK